MPTLAALRASRTGSSQSRPATRLETALLRRSVRSANADRDRCEHCARTPLVGELVHRYTSANGLRLVCDLCRSLRKEPPARSELMHSPEHERAVRIVARAA